MDTRKRIDPSSGVDGVMNLIRRLRGEGGCPWDRKQTPQTIKTYVLEEAHEVLEAVDGNNEAELAEELGDLLFQILFLVVLFEEKGSFALDRVTGTVIEKMTRRHPHVFGDVSVRDENDVLRNWHLIKELERKELGKQSALRSVPTALPALMRAQRVGERASKAGFEVPDAQRTLRDAQEQLQNFVALLDKEEPDRSLESAEALGDLFFSLTSLSRLLKVNAEFALQQSVKKFIGRFEEAQEREESNDGRSEAPSGTGKDRPGEPACAVRERDARLEELSRIQKELGYEFRQREFLETALRHSSFVNENPREEFVHNERLEFLGDALLDLVISRELYRRFSAAREGELTRWRAYLVNSAQLSEIARSIDLGAALQLGGGEESGGGRDKSSILADALEAVLAAVYLDGGLDAAQQVVGFLFDRLLDQTASENDYKSRLQEYTQAREKTVPEYRLLRSWGPDHDKRFHMSVSLSQKELATGEGRTKKEAAQEAARKALELLEKKDISH